MCSLTAEVGQVEMGAEFVIVRFLCWRRRRLLMKNYQQQQQQANKPSVMNAVVLFLSFLLLEATTLD
jgi:hypothetical protein